MTDRYVSQNHDSNRRRHQNLPESPFFNRDSPKGKSERDRGITREQFTRLGKNLGAVILKSYPDGRAADIAGVIAEILVAYINTNPTLLFPDMDFEDVWYTDDYDIIEAAKAMGLGDETLSHWPEESNPHRRYLELSTDEVVQIWMSIVPDILVGNPPIEMEIDIHIQRLLRQKRQNWVEWIIEPGLPESSRSSFAERLPALIRELGGLPDDRMR